MGERLQAHESRIRAVFDAIAADYDRVNRALSFGQDALRVVSAFTLRHAADLPRTFAETGRVRRPGGRAVSLELSEPRPAALALVYHAYFDRVLPKAGTFLGGDANAYAYLPRSRAVLPSVDAVGTAVQDAGFRAVCHARLIPRVAAVHEGTR